ncbi:hypothetical protein GGI43DRAFT_304764 [Trichoderma evansii]
MLSQIHVSGSFFLPCSRCGKEVGGLPARLPLLSAFSILHPSRMACRRMTQMGYARSIVLLAEYNSQIPSFPRASLFLLLLRPSLPLFFSFPFSSCLAFFLLYLQLLASVVSTGFARSASDIVVACSASQSGCCPLCEPVPLFSPGNPCSVRPGQNLEETEGEEKLGKKRSRMA